MENPDNQTNREIKKEKHRNALKWILVLGIVIVLNLFFSVTIRLFYDAPEYETFCPFEKYNAKIIETEEECAALGGRWSEENFRANYPRVTVNIEKDLQRTVYCDAAYSCGREFEDANSLYRRNIFIIMVILGVSSIAAGIFISVSSVSLGLSLGGVLSLIIGSMGYWSDMNDLLRVVVMATALIALIWVGIKKLRD
ncbi:hypothetical protein COV42_00290 [Candidatus Campbellbacteria bacterium CG11_big_fil_rev_8_21_14_0_20_44_21]|uniref:Uncharacterized protein n=1 Tax=Candidatus Campbellbacteria bacterium CG22_combo_CG10-13_8_21_14_all_43_18 TaxID=1974530 RepID=A0A2H0DX83_9BACT|nr:MAG: hypothetical protein COW82_01100 [Candidatus Campbellbacteria bacterium CG22_combo_CG10-13_8_21_14_all_43_18]PIR24516.1 MAG: hypothetical protein COV42_00290 [Candidatus Campbellbacteria bacterium CG11_big_fil_rev_8_21_14_0_20_44_21]